MSATRSILITGCSSGIGYAAAHGMRARGWRVFAACRQQADCHRLSAEGFNAPRLDYTDEASIQSAIAQVLEQTGGTLDAVFNNGAHATTGRRPSHRCPARDIRGEFLWLAQPDPRGDPGDAQSRAWADRAMFFGAWHGGDAMARGV